MLALVCHEFLAFQLFSISSQLQTQLGEATKKANIVLAGTAIDSRFGNDRIKICFGGIASPDQPKECQSALGTGNGSREHSRNLSIGIFAPVTGSSQEVANIVLYDITSLWGVSFPEIKGSTDNILRQLEKIAFNGAASPVTELKLCAGTQKLQTGGNCAVTTRIEQVLSPPIDTIINKVRIGALLLGPVQFLTLSIFFYSFIELVGLWFRWVAPPPILYVIDRAHSEARMDLSGISEAVPKFAATSNRNLGDRLLHRGLAAVNVDANTPEVEAENFAADAEVISTLEAYRVFLLDDATSRQEPLDMLGDTMLKLAFLGTVYGISAALFAARGLDTADPLLKLAAKAEMYSGIGVGFGATLVGITLSITAAILRSNLASAWTEEISIAYRLILDFNVKNLRAVAKRDVPGTGSFAPVHVPSWTAMDRFGLMALVLVFIGVGVYLFGKLQFLERTGL